MGRAYSVREASIKKTGKEKGKLYTSIGREIVKAVKEGGSDTDSNLTLKRIIAKAKKLQVPNDIINSSLKKGTDTSLDDYSEVIYEGFGPGASTLIVKCLTDNVNRTVAFVRETFSRAGKSLGVKNSVSYNYDFLGIISVKIDEETLLNALIENNLDIVNIENNEGIIDIEVNPKDYELLKDVLEKIDEDIEYLFDEVGMFAKEEVKLSPIDLEEFNKLLDLLNDIDDVDKIYHNVEME